MGSSNADLKRFPDPVGRRIGFAVYQAQAGFRHRDAKPLKGFGSGVLEVVARRTPTRELDLIARRLNAAERHYREMRSGR